ncbi:MAG: CDP-diacylglycerol--serine O-phosphatidyltransferase [Solirubrobacterales bacterium]
MNQHIPNAITLLNLSLGSLSIVYTIGHDFRTAAILILLAMIMDGMDGRVARKLQVSSELGKQLDSLSDLVSFGVAPAVLVLTMVTGQTRVNPIIITTASVVFILCGAYRLARFNVLNISEYFVGLPITIAGSLVALIALASMLHIGIALTPITWIVILAALAFFMVSRFTIPKV